MKNKKTKEIENQLSLYPFLELSIRDLKIELDYATKEEYTLQSITFSDGGKPTGYISNDNITNWIANKDENINKIKNKILIQEKEIKKISNALKILSEIEMSVLKKRYFEKNTWEEIAETTMYSSRTARRYCKNAIEKLSKIL